MISCFNHIRDPFPIEEIDVYEFIERIKSPDKETFELIEKARKYRNVDIDKYVKLKEKLPCFTLNFSFNGRKNNNNIKLPTGLIYLDVDNNTDIDFTNPYLFATWLSPSNTGRGILVKVENLNLNNFKYTYLAIANKLNVDADIGAAKATQFTIHSYDKNIYFNENAMTWVLDTTEESKTNFTPNTHISNKKNEGYSEMMVNHSIRYNNYNDFNFKGEKYIYFKDEKKLMASVFVPKIIKRGKRNSILSSIAYQVRALNLWVPYGFLKNYMLTINLYNCHPKLYESEVKSIVDRIMRMKELSPVLNSQRRFLFNPEFDLSFKEKMKIVNSENGKAKVEKTIEGLKDCIKQWDVTKFGKVTIDSLIKVSGRSKGTVEKYYKLLRAEKDMINEKYKKLAK